MRSANTSIMNTSPFAAATVYQSRSPGESKRPATSQGRGSFWAASGASFGSASSTGVATAKATAAALALGAGRGKRTGNESMPNATIRGEKGVPGPIGSGADGAVIVHGICSRQRPGRSGSSGSPFGSKCPSSRKLPDVAGAAIGGQTPRSRGRVLSTIRYGPSALNRSSSESMTWIRCSPPSWATNGSTGSRCRVAQPLAISFPPGPETWTSRFPLGLSSRDSTASTNRCPLPAVKRKKFGRFFAISPSMSVSGTIGIAAARDSLPSASTTTGTCETSKGQEVERPSRPTTRAS